MDTSFQELYEAQVALQRNQYRDLCPVEGDDESRAHYVQWNVTAAVDELHEALREVGWKPWATSRHLNREQYKKELADVLHFFMNLMMAADIDGNEMAEAYFGERAKNVARVEKGYTGVKVIDTDPEPQPETSCQDYAVDHRAWEERQGRKSVRRIMEELP